MSNEDIKWLEEYAEQEKKYKWGKEIKKLIKRNKELEDIESKAIGHIECCKTNKVTKLTNDFVSKDKIRNLLEEYEGTGYYEVEKVLEEVLEGDNK